MKEKIKNKIISVFMIVGILFQIMVPTVANATTYQETFKDGDEIEIKGTYTMNGNTYQYKHGDVTITKNGVAVNTSSFTVKAGDEIVVTYVPDTSYEGRMMVDGHDEPLTGTNTYSFTIGNEDDYRIQLEPVFTQPAVKTIDFTVNGVSFTDVDVENGSELLVPDTFDLTKITNLKFTKIVNIKDEVYTYPNGEYSLSMKDNQNRNILETHIGKLSSNAALFRVESHADDILDADKESLDKVYYGIFFTSVAFYKSGFKGVEVDAIRKPNFYDFTQWNGVDISDTNEDNYGLTTVYYGENEISFTGNKTTISKIELVENKGVPASAISINNSTKKVTINSNYYNKIPLKITTTKDSVESVGYVMLQRIGIFIGEVNVGQKTFYHGASNGNSENNFTIATDKHRIVAAFYHGTDEDYNDYDLISNIIYEDGTTETKVAQGVGDVLDDTFGEPIEEENKLKASDYILAYQTSEKPIERIYVTAVRKGATSNETTFGGAAYGAGAGVAYEVRG